MLFNIAGFTVVNNVFFISWFYSFTQDQCIFMIFIFSKDQESLDYYMLISLCFDQFFGHIQNFLKTQVSGRYAAFTQVCLSSIRNAALTQL